MIRLASFFLFPFNQQKFAGSSSRGSKQPQTFAPKKAPHVSSLPKLKWQATRGASAPASKPDGNTFDVVFINQRKTPVQLFWMDRQGKPKPYGGIESGGQKRQQTRPGAVWMIADPEDKPLGHFAVGDRSSRAVIPGN